ncbi:hypothetical protein BSNK01_03550 [Bacillaceae bacterium]
MFASMHTILITMGITVLLIVTYVLRTNPLYPTGRLIQDIFTKKTVFLHFAATMAVLLFNKIELKIEKEMRNVGDFTPLIHRFEGDIVYGIQELFRNDILTFVLTYFYIVIFTSLMIASLIVYHHERDCRSFYALFYGIMINYMIAVPFYLFFPVNEVWYHHPKVEFLIPEVYPAFENEYRALSGLNNCFPSLHTSLSLTMAIIAMRSTNRRLARFVTFSAGVIVFSIFYLGIHWLSDAVAGSLLALFAGNFALKLSENSAPLSTLPIPGAESHKRTSV